MTSPSDFFTQAVKSGLMLASCGSCALFSYFIDLSASFSLGSSLIYAGRPSLGLIMTEGLIFGIDSFTAFLLAFANRSW